jgi:hypothetical protein
MDGLFRDGRKVGEVVLGARRGSAVELLAVIGPEARSFGLALEDGRPLTTVPLPYEVPALP